MTEQRWDPEDLNTGILNKLSSPLPSSCYRNFRSQGSLSSKCNYSSVTPPAVLSRPYWEVHLIMLSKQFMQVILIIQIIREDNLPTGKKGNHPSQTISLPDGTWHFALYCKLPPCPPMSRTDSSACQNLLQCFCSGCIFLEKVQEPNNRATRYTAQMLTSRWRHRASSGPEGGHLIRPLWSH